jgi:osmoprotectant transport system ATP-binding protein
MAARVSELLDLVGLEAGLANRYPSELSGGQQQRVGVARALAADPPVLLMDEPFGAVDPIVRFRLQDELLRLQQQLHKTIVFVTHDIDEAIKLGDRVVVLNVGGVLEQNAAPTEILARPASEFVAEFVGSERGMRRLRLISVADVELKAADDSGGQLVVAPNSNLLDALLAMLRSESEEATVIDGDGNRLGVLTLERIGREVK